MIKSIHNAGHYKWGSNCDGWHLLKSDSLSVIQEQMQKDTAEKLHYHQSTQQVFYILSGKAIFEINGKELIISAHESIYVPKRTFHRIFNPHDSDLTFLVISEPDAHNDRIEIVDFSEELKEPIKILNYEWLEKYFRVEEGDVISLSNPKEQIINKGGFIFYAKMNNQIVGTVSLLKETENVFELGKMAVTDNAQGNGIGTMLIEHCLNVARKKSIQKLILYSNTKLEPAIKLYLRYGFTETKLEPGHYERANIKMEKIIYK
ncbi:MAG TPA: GNAT family N-acetyltransferase [Bacteroidia bacterium]|nr:GNAT family N-acetyltransferase [Bacteroidia bacterium]